MAHLPRTDLGKRYADGVHCLGNNEHDGLNWMASWDGINKLFRSSAEAGAWLKQQQAIKPPHDLQ